MKTAITQLYKKTYYINDQNIYMFNAYIIRSMKIDRNHNIYFTIVNCYNTKTIKIKNTVEIKRDHLKFNFTFRKQKRNYLCTTSLT